MINFSCSGTLPVAYMGAFVVVVVLIYVLSMWGYDVATALVLITVAGVAAANLARQSLSQTR